MVRGKPSNKKPFLQSSFAIRSFTRPKMISSETSLPASITALACLPSSVPALIAALNISPVEICGMLKALVMF